MTLAEILADPERKRQVVAESVRIVDAEMASKRGLRAAAIRAGFRAFKRVQPGILHRAMDHLLPAFAPAVEPFVARGREAGDLYGYMIARPGEIADALLVVTDARAERASNRVLVGLYRSLRPAARGHVMAAVPRIARLVQAQAG